MIKKRKIYLLLLIILSLTISFTNVDKVNAADISSEYSEEDPAKGGKCQGPANCPENITACCSKSTKISIKNDIDIDAYDMAGNRIDKGIYIYQDTLSGTYVGLNVYEVKSYTSKVSYSVSAIQTYYSCIHTYTYNYGPIFNEKGYLIGYTGQAQRTVTFESIYGCPSGDVSEKKTRPAEPCPEVVSACAASATPRVIELKPSYDAEYRDSNDIDAQPSKDKAKNKYYTAETVEGGICNTSPTIDFKENVASGEKTMSQTCYFYYNRQKKICMNVKTGKVRYINNNQSCDVSTEYELKSESRYWKYFVPLNATSGEDFVFSLNSSGNKERVGICYDIINKYDNYADMITDANNKLLPKIISNMKPQEKRKQRAEAKKQVESSNGCYYKTMVTIPVAQRFYNELEDQLTFKGFNFYYRPIDINEPFPNGINESSLWYEWNKGKKKELDLQKSYNKVTYVSKISNTDAVRKLTNEKEGSSINADTRYLNWQTMYLDGTSEFIEKDGIVTRYVDRNSYYSLGCGPINENEYTDETKKIKNVFYQKECKK